MPKKTEKEEGMICPVGRFFASLERAGAKRSKFFEHVDNSRVEFLKAIRSLVDERIKDIEKKASGSKTGKKATKVEVE